MAIKFHLPDFVRHFKLNLLLAEMMKQTPEFFYDDVEIGSVYGTFPTSLWNPSPVLNLPEPLRTSAALREPARV